MTASNVTVLPVAVSRRPGAAGPDPRALAVENERLRAENAVLRERLANMQAIALERGRRIEDLTHGLRLLPSVWARKLEERLGAMGDAGIHAPGPSPDVLVVEEEARPGAQKEEAVRKDPPPEVPPPEKTAAHPDPPPGRTEAMLAEVAALRARLERRRLEVEREMLDEERARLRADLDWTRRWRRFRRARGAAQ